MRKMVVFDMDNTLLQGRFIDSCAKKYNFRQALALLRNIDTNSISLTKRIGSFLKDKPVQELVRIADEMPLINDVSDVMKELKQRNYIVGIISDSYELITNHIAKKTGADFSISYGLANNDDLATGEVHIPSCFYFNENSSCEHPI
ncbi:MAG: HAD family hydrolase, partial [Chitinophagaceae bacterium]